MEKKAEEERMNKLRIENNIQIQEIPLTNAEANVEETPDEAEQAALKLQRDICSDIDMMFAISYEMFETSLVMDYEARLMEASKEPNLSPPSSPGAEPARPENKVQYNGTRLLAYGRGLFNHAELREGEEAARFLIQAIGKFEEVLHIEKENVDNILVDYGDALLELAKIIYHHEKNAIHLLSGWFSKEQLKSEEENRKRNAMEAKKLVYMGIDKYRESHKVNPQNALCLGNWAGALFDLGEITQCLGQEEESDRCFAEACEKYELSDKADPYDDDDSLLPDWGRAFYERAKMKEGPMAEFFLVKSAEKYSEALKMVERYL